jgi:hypothetical protein
MQLAMDWYSVRQYQLMQRCVSIVSEVEHMAFSQPGMRMVMDN